MPDKIIWRKLPSRRAQSYSPLKYYGGKAKMVKHILPLLPQHTVYAEPFCGGASVLFAKPWPATVDSNWYREAINDTYEDVVNFFRVLRDEVKGPLLAKRLSLTPYSKTEHDRARDTVSAGNYLSDIERAWALFVACRQGFGGQISGGFGRGKYGENTSAVWARTSSSLLPFTERLSSVYVDNIDALEFIKKWDSPHTLFYCDPPYPGTTQDHYNGYTQREFDTLLVALDNCQGSFVLSCFPNAAVPDSWERFELKKKTTISNIKSGAMKTEVLWRRFNTRPVRPEIQARYDRGDYDCFVPRPEDLPYEDPK
jgi:DNA adenine methylase